MALADNLTVQVERKEDLVIIRLAGNFLMSGTREFRQQWEKHYRDGGRRFIIDMMACGHVDSAAFGELVQCQKDVVQSRAAMRVVPSDRVRSMMKKVVLDRVFSLCGSVKEAEELLAASGGES